MMPYPALQPGSIGLFYAPPSQRLCLPQTLLYSFINEEWSESVKRRLCRFLLPAIEPEAGQNQHCLNDGEGEAGGFGHQYLRSHCTKLDQDGSTRRGGVLDAERVRERRGEGEDQRQRIITQSGRRSINNNEI